MMRSHVFPFAAAVLGALLLAAGVAAAQRPAATVLLGDASPPAVPPELRERALAALADALRIRWRVVQPPDPETRLEADQAAARSRARASSAKFEEAAALSTLAAAERQFREAFGRGVVTVEPLLELLLLRAKLHAEVGRSAALREDLGRALVLDPRRAVDPAVFPPPVVKLARGLRAKIAGGGRVPLAVSSEPLGAAAWVDGARRGVTPIVVQVPPGEHFVAVGERGAVVGQAVVAAVGDGARVTLAALARGPAGDDEWRAAARVARARWVVLLTVRPSGQRYELAVRALPAGRGAPQTARSPSAAAEGELDAAGRTIGERVAALLAGAIHPPPLAVVPPDVVTPSGVPPRHEAQRSVLRRWWFWTVIAAVVGGTVAGAVVGTRHREPQVHLVITRD